MHILITGAGGHLGRKLFDFLEARDGFTVSGLDIRPVDHPNIHEADFGGESNWIKYLKNVDVIVHLAADREPDANWQSSIRNNMDATLTLYHHAAELGVSRVILASSNWVQADKRFTDDALDSALSPGPINAYGMSKLFGERTGEYFAKYHSLSIICLRIGWTQWTHNNQPGPHMAMGRWGQEMWLSDHDFLHGFLAAITVENVDFAVLNLMSDNPGMRWDLSETEKTLGYKFQDGAPAVVPFGIKLRSYLKKVLAVSIPKYIERRFPEW